jgi:hypothetical protein
MNQAKATAQATRPLLLLGKPTGKLGKRPRHQHHHLTRGNEKTGHTIFTFNLPAVLTCPGMSAACASCYARRNRWIFSNVQKALHRNWQASRESFFAERMIREIQRRQAQVVRIHSSGDFYDLAYIRKWAQIIRSCPTTRFYAYTRSWRLSGLRDAIEHHLAGPPNLQLWYSCDKDTGLPGTIPMGVRLAWLQEDAADKVASVANLIFRVHKLRKTPVKRIGLTLVCPPENGMTGDRTDCGKCGICWR